MSKSRWYYDSGMRIESVDLFYLSMPEVLDIGDGSQDALLVRVRAGGWEGWGECEAAPLPSIASFVCPLSHSACKPVGASVLGQTLDSPADVRRIGDLVRAESLDLLQAGHTLSGIDIALWDLLGKREGAPVWSMLGDGACYAKRPYASMLFGDTPEETFQKARGARFRAAKFGWGPIGKGTAAEDAAHFRAAREGLGADGVLLVDVGTVWGEAVARAAEALPVLQECGALWLEEPFVSGALGAYAALAQLAAPVQLAAGEGSHNFHMALQLVDHGGIGFLQIDAGRIGGVSVARQAAEYAAARGITYVNHTFTSHLALSASLAPYAGLERDVICEYPVEPKALALAITKEHLLPEPDGTLRIPDGPGFGVSVDTEGLRPYLVDCQIRVGGRVLYETPELRN
jgi:L-alanine-DL-glutamate epimerase-like enolase superfamily enzyme